MKQFFKTVFASTLGVLIASGLLLLIGFITIIGLTVNMSKKSEYIPKANTVFKLELKGSITEQDDKNPLSELFGQEKGSTSLNDIQKAIRMAKKNDNIKGIYLEAGNLSAYPATLEAIRKSLIDFKDSGKFIYAYADVYHEGTYYVSSVADSLFVNPIGAIGLDGLVNVGLFYTGLMDKVGVEYYVFKVGTFKSAVEPFMLNKFSDENREQIESFQSVIWNQILNGICESRNISREKLVEFIDEGLAMRRTKNLLDYKLADRLIYKTEMEEKIKVAAGQKADAKLKMANVDKMVNIKDKQPKSSNEIAVIYAEGMISDQKNPYSLDLQQKRITSKMVQELKKLKDNDKIKAVVMRVNTPGGSAFISEQIWKEVIELKKEKPLVVSMGDMATSGGYYISCAADKIIAEPTTYTGSIGVFGLVQNRTGLYDKLGLSFDAVKTNRYADLGNMTRPMREDEKALIQASVEDTYDLFLTRCADGRGVDKAFIDSVGQGRVWMGLQALERNLIDGLGGLDTAIEEAATLADLADYKIVYSSENKDFFTGLLEKQLEELKSSFIKSALGEEYKIFQTLQDVKPETGIQALLTYDISPL